MVRVEVVDAQGRPVPTADNSITFKVGGEGTLIGVGNGDPNCQESDKASQRSLFNGLAQVILQATKHPGWISLDAASEDLASATVTIEAKPAKLRPAVI